MTCNVQFSPSLLSADFLNLERDVRLIASADPAPEWLHIDVMDGHFVPNLTIGPDVIKSLKKITTIPLDVHLMIDNPAAQLKWYLDAGVDLLTVHVESRAAALANAGAVGSTHAQHHKGTSYTISSLTPSWIDELKTILRQIRNAGAKAGISLNPDTSPETLKPLIGFFDVVLVMSVHPGFAAQSFIPSCADKIRTIVKGREIAREKRGEKAADFLIEVDGGMRTETVRLAVEAGADILVAGNAIFNTDDPCQALAGLRSACCG